MKGKTKAKRFANLKKFPATLRVYVGPVLAAQAKPDDSTQCVFAQALQKKYGDEKFRYTIAYGDLSVYQRNGYLSKKVASYIGNDRQKAAEMKFELDGTVPAGHYSFSRVS